MRKTMVTTIIGGSMLVAASLAGCQSLIPTQPVTFDLQTALSQFEVEANVPTQNTGTGQWGDLEGITIGRGSLQVDPSAITIIPADTSSGKGSVNLQQTSTLVITVWVGPLEDEDTVCSTGEQYGPYTFTLDENLVPIAVEPETVTLTQSTLALLNAGEFSLCIEVVSPVDGTVVIASLTFNLGL